MSEDRCVAKDSEKNPPNKKKELAKQDIEVLSHRIFSIMQQPKVKGKFMSSESSNESPRSTKKPKL
tara:strand:- start:36226 stop:36423 length:198 start_codon:yes stop_codon:yes gene_type:complete